MARVTKSAIGKFSGALGGLVFHQRNGKQFVRQRPQSFLPGTDPESVDRRLRFGFSVKLAQSIYSIPELAIIWRNAAPKNKPLFNFIVGANTKKVNAGSVTSETCITPPWHLRPAGAKLIADCADASISSGCMEVELTVPAIPPSLEARGADIFKLISIICLMKSLKQSLPDYRFVQVVSPPQQFTPGASITFNIPLNSQDANDVENYEEKKLLAALVAFDDQGNIVDYTATIVK